MQLYVARCMTKSCLIIHPETFKHVDPVGKEFFKEKEAYTLQVSVEDCTGCNLCVELCPVASKTEPHHKAINMVDKLRFGRNGKRKTGNIFLSLPEIDRRKALDGTTWWSFRWTHAEQEPDVPGAAAGLAEADAPSEHQYRFR